MKLEQEILTDFIVTWDKKKYGEEYFEIEWESLITHHFCIHQWRNNKKKTQFC